MNVYYPLFTKVSAQVSPSEWKEALIVSLDLNNTACYGICTIPSTKGRADDWSPCDLKREDVRFEDPRTGDLAETGDAEILGATAQYIHRKIGDPIPENYVSPRSIKHAMTYPDWPDWEEAAAKERSSIESNGVLTYDNNPPYGVDILGSRMMLTMKTDKNGCKEKNKGRFICQGFGHIWGKSFEETFAPTMHLECLRLLLLLCLKWSLTCLHLDVATAYLNSEIKFDVWIKLPEGFKEGYKYAKLNKSLYGLKQAAKDWFDTQDAFLREFEPLLRTSVLEPCLYYLISNEVTILILVHVDDYVVAHNNEKYY